MEQLKTAEMSVDSQKINFDETISCLNEISEKNKNFLKTSEEAIKRTWNNPNSCLSEIRTIYVNILPVYGNTAKHPEIIELKELIEKDEYREFQRRIGCPISECDGKLGITTLTKYARPFADKMFGNQNESEKGKKENQEEGSQDKEQIDQGHMITEQEFDKYFSGESFRQVYPMGDCRLVAAVDSLVSLGEYKELIMNNVRRIDNGFIFRMPLRTRHGESAKIRETPLHSGDSYIVTKDMYSGERSKRGKLHLLSGKEGHKALAYALGRIYTGHDDFSYEELEGLAPWDASPLEYAVYPTVSERKERSDEGFLSSIENLLGNFDHKTDMMTIGVQQGEGYSELLPLNLYYGRGHMLSIEKTRHTNGKLMVRISNPWNAGMYYDISFERLKKYVDGYNWASLDINKGKNKKVKGPYDERLEKAEKDGDSEGYVMKYEIESTGRRSIKQRRQRDLKIYEHKSKKIYTVESRGGHAINIELKNDSVKFSVVGHNDISISIPRNNFSTQEEFDIVDSSLYIANFINKMAHDYIKPQKAKKNHTGPFEWRSGSGIEFQHKIDGVGGLARNIFKNGNVQVLTENTLKDTYKIKDIRDTGIKLVEWLNELYKLKI